MSDDFFALHLDDHRDESPASAPSGWSYLTSGASIRCTFSADRTMRMGMGASARTRQSRNYWYVEQAGRQMFEALTLGKDHLPGGEPVTLTLQDLMDSYTPDLARHEELVMPAMLESGKPLLVEHATLDEGVVKGLFGLGLIYHGRGEDDRARVVLGDIARLKTPFEGCDQHLFNDFGIGARKCGLFPEALALFRRALTYAQNDDHLFYNLARAHYENDQWEECLEFLTRCHELNPELFVARDLLELMAGLAENRALLARYQKPPVPADLVRRVQELLDRDSAGLSLDEEPVSRDTSRVQSDRVGVVELHRRPKKRR